MGIKLTGPQIELLKQRKGTFIDRYKPGQKLRDLALIDATDGKYGNVNWTINAAGEKVLAEIEAGA